MDLAALFVRLLVFCLVFGLLYYLVTLVAGVLPPPVAAPARVVLLVLLCLIAICVLLDTTGVLDVGLGLHRRWR